METDRAAHIREAFDCKSPAEFVKDIDDNLGILEILDIDVIDAFFQTSSPSVAFCSVTKLGESNSVIKNSSLVKYIEILGILDIVDYIHLVNMSITFPGLSSRSLQSFSIIGNHWGE